MSTIRAAALTTYGVNPDGRQVRIHLRDQTGKSAVLELPTQALSELMMTLPRMLQQALQKQYDDSSLRLVHELGDFQLEQAGGIDRLILTLKTTDGFEVSFAVTNASLAEISSAASVDHFDSRVSSHLM